MPVAVCVYCEKDYEVEEAIATGGSAQIAGTICFDGQRECVGVPKDVSEKFYFIAGSPGQQNTKNEHGLSLRVSEITNVCVRQDTYKPYPDLSADSHNFNGLIVKFVDNRYSTSSPVEQFLIEDRAAKNPGWLCSEQEWEKAWFSPEERIQRLEKQIEGLRQKVGA